MGGGLRVVEWRVVGRGEGEGEGEGEGVRVGPAVPDAVRAPR